MTASKDRFADRTIGRKRKKPAATEDLSNRFNDSGSPQNPKYIAGTFRQIKVQNEWIDRSEKRRRRDPSQDTAADIKNLSYFLDKLLALPTRPLYMVTSAWCDGVCPRRMAGDRRVQFEWVLERAGLNTWNKFEGCLQGCRNGGLHDTNTQYCVVLCVYILRLRPSAHQIEAWHGNDSSKNPSKRSPPITWTEYLKQLAPPALFKDMQDAEPTHVERWMKATKAMYEAAAREEYYELQRRANFLGACRGPKPFRSTQFISEDPERLFSPETIQMKGSKSEKTFEHKIHELEQQIQSTETRSSRTTHDMSQASNHSGGVTNNPSSTVYNAPKPIPSKTRQVTSYGMTSLFGQNNIQPAPVASSSGILNFSAQRTMSTPSFQFGDSVPGATSSQSRWLSQFDEGNQPLSEAELLANIYEYDYEPWQFDNFPNIDFCSDVKPWQSNNMSQHIGVDF